MGGSSGSRSFPSEMTCSVMVALMAAAVVLGACGDDDGLARCPEGMSRCGCEDESCPCIDLLRDEASCGGCGHVCPVGTHRCIAGRCELECPAGVGAIVCDRICVQTLEDERNCGACGVECGDGESCIHGACDWCEHDWMRACGDECVDTGRDARHCGRCGNACSGCVDGRCCSTLEVECDGACVDLRSSAAHCGACGRACPDGFGCERGECVCNADDRAMCGDECARVDDDPRHCGGCGRTCDGTCARGLCCPRGTLHCGVECIDDPESNPDRCGACDVLCARDEACVGGRCVRTSGCARTDTDARSCGGCDLRCLSSSGCVEGRCTCEDGLVACAPRVVGAPWTCADLARDRLDCGACGTECAIGETCIAGVCAAGACERVCGEQCVANDDPRHCGGCGAEVPEGAECVDGRIVCPGGERTCGASYRDLVLRLEIDCGRAQAGDSPRVCSATLLSVGSIEPIRQTVTTSPHLRWTEGRCAGPTCRDAANAPSLVEGSGVWPDAGTLVPAGATSSSTVTSDVELEVRARLQIGTLDIEGRAYVVTTPTLEPGGGDPWPPLPPPFPR